jgi:hypothetical protein
MMKNFTLEFLINSKYPDRKNNVFSINNDPKNGLFKAPERCVDTVMNFARSYKVADSKMAGKIELLMN